MSPFMISVLALFAGVRDRFAPEKGATAVEYGLLVALIAAVIIVVVATLGTQINTAFNTVAGQL